MRDVEMNLILVMATTTAHRSLGISLIETLTILAILGTLMGLAAPQFQLLRERWQVLQATRALESTFMMARSEAIKQGGRIGIRKHNNGTNGCNNAATNQAWGCGWFVYLDTNSNGSWNASEPQLQNVTLDGSVNVMHTSGGINIRFDRYGMASGLNAKGFTFSPERTGINSPATHSLCMSSGGRIRIIADSSCPTS